jgi:hypothetical protein
MGESASVFNMASAELWDLSATLSGQPTSKVRAGVAVIVAIERATVDVRKAGVYRCAASRREHLFEDKQSGDHAILVTACLVGFDGLELLRQVLRES